MVDFEVFYQGKKEVFQARDLYDAKQKAIALWKVPKSKQGLIAIQSLTSKANQDFRFA